MNLKLRRPVWLCLALVVLAAAVNAEASNQDVGALEKVANNVYGTPPEASRTPQHPGDAVAFQELLETLVDSGALVRFTDGSQLTVGAQSKVLVDQFVFNPGTATGNALISITSGALRFATGAMPKGKTVIDTPTATLTLRGTVVRVGVGANGNTALIVDEGSVDIHNKPQNTNHTVPAGDSVTISPGGFGSGDSTVGDTYVDNGFADADNGSGDVEQRRNGSTNRNTQSSNGSQSGSSSSSGSTGTGPIGGPSGPVGTRGN
jgi:hypothetical protein